MRLFAAVDLSNEAQDAMAAEQQRIAVSLGPNAAPLKWVRPDRAHLTLVFLGDVDAVHVPARNRIPSAIARATGSLTAPCSAITASATPARSVFDRLL